MTIKQETRLRDLKLFLLETDFKIIKCYEASLLNEPLPYNLQELIAQRKAWREEINILREQINEETSQ